MEVVSAKSFRFGLTDILNKVSYLKETFFVSKNGKKVAVLMSIDEYNKLLEKSSSPRDKGGK